MSKNKIAKFVLQLLGPLIFLYILFQIDYGIFLGELKTIKWCFLVFAAGLMIFEIIVRSFRWRAILSALDIYISKASSLSLFWLGVFIGIITPGRIGEVAKIYFLKNKEYSAFRSFFSVILDRVIDIVILLLLGALIAWLFLKSMGFYVVIIGAFFVAAIIFIFMLIDKRSFLHQIFNKFTQKFLSVNFNHYGGFTFGKFWRGIKSLKKKDVVPFILYLVFSWFLYFYSRYVIALSLGISLSFMDVIIVSVSMAIVSILPISVAGIGTREAAVIYIFSIFGLGKETALLFSLLVFTVNMISVAFGFIPYTKESALIDRAKKEASN